MQHGGRFRHSRLNTGRLDGGRMSGRQLGGSGPTITAPGSIDVSNFIVGVDQTITAGTAIASGGGSIAYQFRHLASGEIKATTAAYAHVAGDAGETAVAQWRAVETGGANEGATPWQTVASGTIVAVPAFTGPLPAQSFTEDTGDQTFDVGPYIDAVAYSVTLVGAPVGVSIGGTVITFDTDIMAVQAGTSFTVRATNAAGSTDASAEISIVAAPTVGLTQIAIQGHSIMGQSANRDGLNVSSWTDLAAAQGIPYGEHVGLFNGVTSVERYNNPPSGSSVDIRDKLENRQPDDPQITYLFGIAGMNDSTGLDPFISDLVRDNSPGAWGATPNQTDHGFGPYGAWLWHEACITHGGMDAHVFVRWYGSSNTAGAAGVWDQAWRNRITDHTAALYDKYKEYVEHYASQALPFLWVNMDAAFALLFDRIQAGTYVNITIEEMAADAVHMYGDAGRWFCWSLVWASLPGASQDLSDYPDQNRQMSAPLSLAKRTELFDCITSIVADPTLPYTAPSAFSVGHWSIAETGNSGEAQVTLSTIPVRTPTRIDYRIDGGPWVDSGVTSGTFTITGLTDDQSVNIELRSGNMHGNSPASDSKAVTTSSSSAGSPASFGSISTVAEARAGSSIVCSPPVATSSDVIIAILTNDANNVSEATASAGWTEIGSTYNPAFSDLGVKAFWARGDVGNLTFTVNASGVSDRPVHYVVINGADTAAPISAASFATLAGTSVQDFPTDSIATPDGCMVLAGWMLLQGVPTVGNAPENYTNRLIYDWGTLPSMAGLVLATRDNTPAGSTGALTHNLSGQAWTNRATFIIAVSGS